MKKVIIGTVSIAALFGIAHLIDKARKETPKPKPYIDPKLQQQSDQAQNNNAS